MIFQLRAATHDTGAGSPGCRPALIPNRPGRKETGASTRVIAEAEAYLRSYLSFPDGTYYLPLALFAALMHCWDECFDEVPYLSVGAAVKAAGKTRVLELLGFLAGEERSVLLDGSVTEAALYTEIAHGKTLLIDESERLRTPRSPLRPTLNGGYRRGQSVCRKVGRQNVRFSTFCPKVFSHLGDVSTRCGTAASSCGCRGPWKGTARSISVPSPRRRGAQSPCGCTRPFPHASTKSGQRTATATGCTGGSASCGTVTGRYGSPCSASARRLRLPACRSWSAPPPTSQL